MVFYHNFPKVYNIIYIKILSHPILKKKKKKTTYLLNLFCHLNLIAMDKVHPLPELMSPLGLAICISK